MGVVSAEQILLAGYAPLAAVIGVLFWQLRKRDEAHIAFAEKQIEQQDERGRKLDEMISKILALGEVLSKLNDRRGGSR